jgi:hypothetical protein
MLKELNNRKYYNMSDDIFDCVNICHAEKGSRSAFISKLVPQVLLLIGP